VAEDQFEVGAHIERDNLQAGDLVFFRDDGGHIHHEGMYIGGGKFIHAPHTGDVVKISSLDEPYYLRQFAGGRRLIGGAEVAAEEPGAVENAPAGAPAAAPDPDSGVFTALRENDEQASAPPRSTVQFLPAVEPPQDE
jgi:hypothetical protein